MPKKTTPSTAAVVNTTTPPAPPSIRLQFVHHIRAGYAGLHVVSHEEQRVCSELQAALKEDRLSAYTLYQWTCTQGITGNDKSVPDTDDPRLALDAFLMLPEHTVLFLRDFHVFLKGDHPDPLLIRKLKEAIAIGKASHRHLITVGCMTVLPPELEKEVTVLEFDLPGPDELFPIVERLAAEFGIELNGNREEILRALQGQTTIEAENNVAKCLVECGQLDPVRLAREKCATVKQSGLLEFIEPPGGFAMVGGSDMLKAWIARRIKVFTKEARAFGLPAPKGLLLLGVQGCGKSLSCKAIAATLKVPMLRLDAGALMAKHVGESEANARRVIKLAEAVAPCVLWIDEIEKGFSGSRSSGNTDGGTMARVFGTFLTWMAEKTAPVFILATANDVTQLPPEFIRKGRWDEMFFVDLPTESERTDIFRVQLARFGRDPEDFSLSLLAQCTPNFTGAEIEAAVSEGLFVAFDDGVPLTDGILADAIKDIVPIAETMKPQVEGLRAWANGRARRASARPEPAMAGTRKLTT